MKELYNWLEVDFHPLKLSGRVTKVNYEFSLLWGQRIHIYKSWCWMSLCLIFCRQVLNWVRDQAEKEPDLQQYVPHLQNNTILRLLQQVSFSCCSFVDHLCLYITCWFILIGCTDLPKHRVQSSGLPGPVCRCFSAGALHCGCSASLWPAGKV